jgi:hypothetical protein
MPQKKAGEYLNFGVEHVWVIDPYARVAYRGTTAGLERVPSGELAVPGTPIAVHTSRAVCKARLDSLERETVGKKPAIMLRLAVRRKGSLWSGDASTPLRLASDQEDMTIDEKLSHAVRGVVELLVNADIGGLANQCVLSRLTKL